MEDVFFELKHVSGIDSQGIPLSDVSMKVRQGEMHVILSMDYTELKCMLQLLSGRFLLKKGRVLVHKELISMKELGNCFQYVVSDTVIYDDMSVFDNIYLMKSQLFSFFRRRVLKAELQKLMEDISVPLDLSKSCRKLTKQEKRILLYYRAIVNRPKLVLVFDSSEETNIDYGEQFKRLLEYMKQEGIGLVYLTSSSEKALYFADQLSLLRDGQLVGPIRGDDVRRNPRYILQLFREWSMYTEASMQQVSIEESWLETVNIMSSRSELQTVIRYIARNIASSVRAEECIIYIAYQEFQQMLAVSNREEPETLVSLEVLKKMPVGGERYLCRGEPDMPNAFREGKDLGQIYLKCTVCRDATIVIQLCMEKKRALDDWKKEYLRVVENEIYHTIKHSKLLGNTDMLREVHHRIKNNLQLIVSLLEMQKYSREPLTPEALDSTICRVKSIALVHDMFAYRSSGAECGLVSLKNLMYRLTQIYESERMAVKIEMMDILVPYDTATSVLLVLNELLNNAWKYAFGEGEAGEVLICVKEDTQMVHFTVWDNGKGMPEDFDVEQAQTMGYMIIKSIVANDLKGYIHLNRKMGGQSGTTLCIDVPKTSLLPKM